MQDAPNPSGQVSVCPVCGRVSPSLSRDEYTPQRAELIIERGLCVCPGDAMPTDKPAEVARRPARRSRGDFTTR